MTGLNEDVYADSLAYEMLNLWRCSYCAFCFDARTCFAIL